ncbi:UBX domain-containing protein 7-like isoform X2 [Watersipora subatra]
MHIDSSVVDSIGPRSSEGTSTDLDAVRAPIPQKQEILVEHDGYLLANQRKRKRTSNPNSVFDKFRDFQAEAREQESLLKNGANQVALPAHLIRLEDLFRPPLDIIYHGSLISAQAKGKAEKKWVLVNVQNTTEFSCQVLNRDIWKNLSIREIVTNHFILWQVYHDSVEGQKYMQFYPVTTWPYVAIVHPVTAELLESWSSLTLRSFQKDLQDFIRLHGRPNDTNASTLTAAANLPVKHTRPAVDASEESQLEAALQASLEEVKRKETQEQLLDGDSSSSSNMKSDSDDETAVDKKRLTSGFPTTESMESCLPSIPSTPPSNKDARIDGFWTDHISQEGTDISILFKKPDMSRCQWEVKSKSTIKALILYVESLGFKRDAYEVMANFPSRKISRLPLDKTLEECKFQKQETFYIQKM